MGIMTAITATTWDITCKACAQVRTLLIGVMAAIIAFTETAGRSRAASELARQGYYKEAHALMMELKEIKEKNNAL
jgi:hypothetical protein